MLDSTRQPFGKKRKQAQKKGVACKQYITHVSKSKRHSRIIIMKVGELNDLDIKEELIPLIK